LNFKWKAYGEWVLAVYGANLAQRRTQAAGDIVQFFVDRNAFALVVQSFKFAGEPILSQTNGFCQELTNDFPSQRNNPYADTGSRGGRN
jgi:hypothetical protein